MAKYWKEEPRSEANRKNSCDYYYCNYRTDYKKTILIGRFPFYIANDSYLNPFPRYSAINLHTIYRSLGFTSYNIPKPVQHLPINTAIPHNVATLFIYLLLYVLIFIAKAMIVIYWLLLFVLFGNVGQYRYIYLK